MTLKISPFLLSKYFPLLSSHSQNIFFHNSNAKFVLFPFSLFVFFHSSLYSSFSFHSLSIFFIFLLFIHLIHFCMFYSFRPPSTQFWISSFIFLLLHSFIHNLIYVFFFIISHISFLVYLFFSYLYFPDFYLHMTLPSLQSPPRHFFLYSVSSIFFPALHYLFASMKANSQNLPQKNLSSIPDKLLSKYPQFSLVVKQDGLKWMAFSIVHYTPDCIQNGQGTHRVQQVEQIKWTTSSHQYAFDSNPTHPRDPKRICPFQPRLWCRRW